MSHTKKPCNAIIITLARASQAENPDKFMRYLKITMRFIKI